MMEQEVFSKEELEKLRELALKDGEHVYNLGKKYADEKKEAKAFTCYEYASFYSNHNPALVEVARCYMFGRGTDINFFSAINMLEMAAKRNSATAQFYLGLFYLDGIFYLRDYKKAFDYLSNAAKNGNKQAYYFLGLIYWHGLGKNPDKAKAIKCFENAPSGNDFALYYLGYAYYKGLGVNVDYSKAFYWFNKSANENNYYARAALAYCYYKGIGVNKNIDAAIEMAFSVYREDFIGFHQLNYLLNKALCEQSRYEEAEKLMAVCKEFSKPPKEAIIAPGNYYDYLVEHDKRHKEWQEKCYPCSSYSDEELDVLCKQNNDDAILRRAYRYIDSKKGAIAYNLVKKRLENGGDKNLYSVLGYMYANKIYFDKDYDKSISCYKIAYEQGHSINALYNLGIVYKNGFNDYDKSKKCILKAAEAGHFRAQEYLFEHYAKGDNGFPLDKEKALYYGELAAKNGSVIAQRRLWNYYLDIDFKKALKYMIYASEQEDRASMNKLADIYRYGRNHEQNLGYACALYYLGAENDSNSGCVNLACECHYGDLLFPNDIAASFWLDMACQRNYTLAKVKMKQWFKIEVE